MTALLIIGILAVLLATTTILWLKDESKIEKLNEELDDMAQKFEDIKLKYSTAKSVLSQRKKQIKTLVKEVERLREENNAYELTMKNYEHLKTLYTQATGIDYDDPSGELLGARLSGEEKPKRTYKRRKKSVKQEEHQE